MIILSSLRWGEMLVLDRETLEWHGADEWDAKDLTRRLTAFIDEHPGVSADLPLIFALEVAADRHLVLTEEPPLAVEPPGLVY